MWVTKTVGDEIAAFCMACKTEEMLIHNWQESDPLPSRVMRSAIEG
jgi:hypothetical protein